MQTDGRLYRMDAMTRKSRQVSEGGDSREHNKHLRKSPKERLGGKLEHITDGEKSSKEFEAGRSTWSKRSSDSTDAGRLELLYLPWTIRAFLGGNIRSQSKSPART
jgi:hypothetical protein